MSLHSTVAANAVKTEEMQTPIMVVALVGPKQSGKTTTASQMQTAYGFERFRFADTLKAMVEVLGVPRDHIDGDRKEEPLDILCGHSGRYAMQTLGTEWRDLLGRDLWAKITADKIKKQAAIRGLLGKTDPMIVVVDDLRFPHEVDVLKHAFGEENVTLWRIDTGRPYPKLRTFLSRHWWGRVLLKPFGKVIHMSEVWWPVIPVDRVIDNKADVQTLFAGIAAAIDAAGFPLSQTQQRITLPQTRAAR